MEIPLDTPSSLKRKRALLACIPCRERKRKCDGRDPCCTCTSWGYDCYYLARRPRSRKTRASTPDPQPRPRSPPQETSGPNIVEAVEADRGGLVRRLEANSGAAFVRKLGLKIDPAKAPKLNLFSWNIGTRQPASPITSSSAIPIVEITSLDHMRAMAQVYFEKVHPCYGFIDRDDFFDRLDLRWKSPLLWDLYDSTLAGVAALGCLFSLRDATITELHLIRTARTVLDMQHLSGPPSIDLLTGWILRSIYLRMTDSPHSTWIASSTLMHLVEASGLHPESHSVLPPRVQCDPDIQRRLVGVAHHLNVWTSYDLGLSRVSFQKNDLPALPSPKPGDCTVEVLRLLPVSVSLDPGKSRDEADLTSTLSSLLDGTHTQPPSVMAQCNLVLCILRRIHTQNLDIPSELAAKVLRLLKKGLGCARSMVMDCSPWHQVANVPFHIICVLLVMDTRSSLAMLPEAMQTVGLVASTYDTETMREAYSTACLLVMLHQQRRKDDLAVFGEALNVHQQERPLESPPQLDPSSEEYSWLGALVADLPGLQRIDLDQFLNADMIDTSLFSGP
ncbi:Protein RDR1 [Penicillium daleae]|uniref:Protein RDR1 n=1 Tax=Penicillium daleae TaxID=63821 RepID=A0AAD6G1G0_9EURO|nr:Protein RDR1 [Penicillium daleae]KAJ5444178.1 Protein RDR1 [Penicillium daleae]